MTAPAPEFEWHGWQQGTTTPPPPPSTYPQEVLADSPAAYYRLGEAVGATVMVDASGNARNGTYVSTPTLGVAGLDASTTDTAANLDGVGEYADVPFGAWMRPAAWTVEALIKPDKVTRVGGGIPILARHHSSQYQYWMLMLNNGKLAFEGRIGSGNTFPVLVAGTTALTVGTTYHVAATFDGNVIRVYLDGVLEAISGGAGAAGSPPTIDLAIGALTDGYSAGNGWVFDGVIDEVAFYPVALPGARLAAHHTASVTPPPPIEEPQPVDEWPVDVARSSALIGWATRYGRGDSNGKTAPLQVTVDLAAARAGDCPPLGERFRLTLSAARAVELGIDDEAVRFTGEVTDARVDPNRRPGGVYTITGVGRLGRAARRRVDPRWPQEDDGSRVNRVLTAVGVDVGTIDPGTVDLLPALTAATAGQLLDRVVDSTLGQVVEQPTGLVDYHDAEHRRDTPVTVDLAASEIVNDLDWSQHVGDVINDVTVTYGNPQATVRAYDPASIDERDAYPGSLSTDLVTASDAYSLGTLIVARRRDPAWQLPALVIDFRAVDDAKLAQLLGLRHGDRLRVTEFPAGGPYAGVVELFVEGWTESLVRPNPDKPATRWRLGLAVSDPVLSGVGLRWSDVPAGLTWDQVDPTLTWLDVATLTDSTHLGA